LQRVQWSLVGIAQRCMDAPRPETPPRYRYVSTGASDEEETSRSEKSSRKVLAARKRAGSVGRPVLLSRNLDRQRHGGSEQMHDSMPKHTLQAPALLKLGQLNTPLFSHLPGSSCTASLVDCSNVFQPMPRPRSFSVGRAVAHGSGLPLEAAKCPESGACQRSLSAGRTVRQESPLGPCLGLQGAMSVARPAFDGVSQWSGAPAYEREVSPLPAAPIAPNFLPSNLRWSFSLNPGGVEVERPADNPLRWQHDPAPHLTRRQVHTQQRPLSQHQPFFDISTDRPCLQDPHNRHPSPQGGSASEADPAFHAVRPAVAKLELKRIQLQGGHGGTCSPRGHPGHPDRQTFASQPRYEASVREDQEDTADPDAYGRQKENCESVWRSRTHDGAWQGAVLQKIFWEELERTRARLRQAGINQRSSRNCRNSRDLAGETRENEQHV